MPTLPNYTAPAPQSGAPSGGRRAAATDFYGGTDGLGKAVAHAGDQYITSLEEDESRKALVQSTQVRAVYARKLDEAAQNGGDLTEIKQNMLDDLSLIGDGFQTKKATETLQLYTANSEIMYDQEANRIEATRAGAEARMQGQQLISSDASIIQRDPAYLPEAEKNVDALVSTFTKLPPEKRAEIAQSLKQEQNMAAALSTARIDPEGTKKKLEEGKWNLSPEHRNTAINMVDTQIRAKRAEEAYVRAEDERQKRELDDNARDTHFADIVGGKATRASIMDDAALRPQTREHLILLMEARAKELRGQEKVSDPATKRDLWLAANAPEGDPNRMQVNTRIIEAVRDGLLNTTDADKLNTLVANQKDENGRTIGQKTNVLVSVVGRALSQDPQFTAQPALVAEIQNDYIARVDDKMKQLRQAGDKNPTRVFDPNDKDYVGSRVFIQGAIDAAKDRQRAAAPQVPNLQTMQNFGKREDGSAKGLGYLGVMRRPDGGVSSELSIGVNVDGKEMEIPSMVPGLSKDEVKTLLSLGPNDKMPESIVTKAVDHARARIKEGKPVFATIEDAIPVGTPFIDPNGVQRVMTKELLAALKKREGGAAAGTKPPEFPVTPSGETPTAAYHRAMAKTVPGRLTGYQP